MLTKIINIEARWGRSVTEFLPAGDYKVEYIGIAQGGQYNAWNYRYNYYPYWSNQYQIDSSEFSFSTGRLSENWGNDTLALANAKNTTFVLKNAGNVTFWIYDTVYEDNTGGVSLRVTSIPTPATNITLSNNNIAENQAVNTVIGDFTSTDPDPGDTFIYSLVSGAGDTDNSFFTISNNQLKSNSVFDYEAKTSYSIRVRTTDQDGQFYEKQLTVNVTNIIEPGTFSFSDNNYVVKEDGTVVKAITINRTNNFEGAVSVTVTPTDGTATSVNDYKNTPIVVNFAAGEASKTVNLTLINDTAYELEENLNLAITNVTGGAIIGTQNKATLTILNDDVAIPGVLAFSAPTYTLTENGTTITQVTVTRTGGSDTEVSATITLNNGTATAEDYNNTPIKVTFAHGDSAPKIITIPIKEDSQFEAVETLNLSLTNPTNGVTIGTQNTAIVKIIDNDNFVFNNIDIQPTKLEKLTLPIPTALKQYEILSSELDKAKVKLDTTEEQLRLANDDYSFAKETFEGSLSKQKSLTDILQNLANKKTALTSSFTQSKTQNEQKQKDIQKNIDDAYTRLKAETNAGIKDGIQKEINGYLIQIQDQQNLLSIATTKYNWELAVVIFQIDDSNQELQGLESNIIPKQVEDLEKKNPALVDVKTAWEASKQAVTVADKALGDLLTDYAFLKTQDYSSKFLQDTVDSLKQKIGALQANLTALKSGNGSNSEIAALEKAILEKQKVVGEVQEYQKTVLAGELEFKQELETRKGTSADHEASVKVALGNNNIEGYVSLNSQLANQLKGLTTVWVDNLEDNHNLTIKVWNGSQATSQAFDSLTSYIDENLATPYGDYYLNEIQLDEALQIRESTVRRRDALADSVDFVEDALFLAKKQLQEYKDLAKLGQHYSDLTKYEKEFNQLNVVESKLATINQFQQKLVTTTAKLTSVKEDNKNKLALAGQKGAITRPETGNKYFWTNSTSWEDAQAQGEAVGGNLVTINDGNEQNWAIQIRPRNVGYFWLGLTDKFQEGRWQWISGEPITYTYWRPGEPNNHSGAENYGLVWINNEWNDGTNGSLPGLIEINLQSLAQKETTITQDIEKTRAGFNSAVTDLLKSLDSPFLRNTESLKAGIIQKQALNDSYLTQAKWYSDQAAIYWDKSKKQGATWVEYTQVQKTKVSKYWETVTTTHNDPNWVTWDDYTKKSQALQQQSADFLKSISDDVQAFISQSDLVLQPKLINAVSDEVTNKSQDLVVQIDLTNDQQEQWIETNLQKYIEQKQNSIVKAQEAPLTAIRETFEQPNRALFFDGVNDYIQINLNEPETEVTHELWFKTTSLNGGLFSVVAGNLGSTGLDRGIYLSNGNIVARIWNDETISSSGLNLADGKWHHVAHVFGASVGGQQIYIDGQLVATGSKSISDFNWQDKIAIGYSFSGYFKGEIDEVRVWNVAKTQAQIQTYYNRNLTGKEQGLAGYWNFEEITGNTVNDLTANKNNGTLTNGVQRTVANTNPITRPEGKTLYFDGVNDYINAGTNPSLEVTNTLTIEAWINPQKQIQADGGIIVNREGEYEIAVWSDGTIRWAFANSNPGWNWINTGYTISIDKWTHIAVSYDKGLIKTYANGSLVHTYDGTGTIGDVFASQDEFRIGYRQAANSQYFKGQIDEVRIWNTVKAQAEIQANINQKLSGNEQGLVGYWNFEEGTVNTVNDLTANKNNGTLINGVQRTVANTNLIIRPEGKALYFDGVNDYINAGTNPSLEVGKTLTLEAWIKPQKNSDYGVIAGRDGEYMLTIGPDNKIYYTITNTQFEFNRINTDYTIPLDKWTHIAFTYDNGLIKTYVNGELIYSYDSIGTIRDQALLVNYDEFHIGNRQYQNLNYFKGEIDEVRVWNVARTQAEIQANLNQKLLGNEQGLVGYWNFEETSGHIINDLTANSNHGMLINGVQRTVANTNLIIRPEGKALYFDGVNDYINAGTNPSLEMTNSFTLEAWIKPQQNSQQGVIISREGEYRLAIGTENTIYFAIANGNPSWSWINTGYKINLNQWSHIALTYDKGLIKTYVGGELVYSYDGAGIIGDHSLHANQDDLRIGNRQWQNLDSFKGEMDEVRVWNIARTQAEIQANISQKLTGNEQGLIGYWNFEENTGNTVNDLTANKNNGTLINGVQRTVANSNPITRPEGKALYFDGVNDSIQMNLNEPETEVTHELWFKTTSLNGGLFSVVAGNLGSTGLDRGIYLSNGNIVARIWNDETISSSGLNLADGKWHHVAHVFGASVGGQQIYIDGQLVATGSKSISDFNWQDKIAIGYSADSGYFKGEIDDVRVWNVAKTQSQIQASLSQKLTGNEQGLIGYWNFEENTGNTVNDLTANKNNGTLTNELQRTIDSSVAVPQVVTEQTNIIESKTISDLQSLRLETAYLTLQSQQNPEKVQNYLQNYNALKVLGTTDNQGTDLSLFDIVTPEGGVYQDWLRFDYGANIIPGDFNGDGKTDFIRQEKGGWDDETSNSFNIYFSKGDGKFDIITPNIQDYQIFLRFDPGANLIPGDYNGDGKTDFIRQEKGGWDDDTIASFQIYISRGDGYFDIITPNNADYQNYLRFDPGVNIIPGDYNGDRKTDFIRQEKGGWDDDTIASFQIYVSRGDGYFDIITPEGGVYQDWLRFDYGANIIPGDFNGDGKTDFIRQEKGGWDDETSNSFNIYFSKGDGKFDIITPNIQDYQTFLRFDPGANLIPGDYNGDGKTDFIRQEKGGWDDDTIASFQIYVSRGDGYFDIITPENGVYQDWLRFDYGANIISGDYNGDGYDDFIRQEKGGWDDDLTNNFNVYFSNPAKQQALKLLGSNDGVKNITLNSLRTQYYPELNNPTTLATLQQQISDQQTQSQQQIDQLKNSISQKQAQAAASISQADWYQEKSAFYWEQSRKQGPTWTESRSYKKKKLFGSKTEWVTITHVDHNWIIWDTYTKQATALREHADQLLKGATTDTLNKDTTTTILDQWNKASAVANEAALSQSEFIHLLQQLEAERKLSEDKIAQISDWEKLLPILQNQLEIATQDAATATANIQKETGEYQTSKDNYLNALNSVLQKRAELQTKTQLLQQDITTAKNSVIQQTTYLADELTQSQTLISQLQTKRQAIAQQLTTATGDNKDNLLTQQAQLDQSIQLLTQKQTVLTAQQATLTQKQTLLSTQEQVLLTEYQLLDVTLASPDKDTSTLEQQLTDTRKTLAEVQKLAEQAEASSQALTAVMDDLQASLLLQNDKYLSAIKDKQQGLKKLLEATELEKNYTLQATTKRQELNGIESQLLTILKQANDAGSQEAAQLLEVANANNMATAAELYYKDYRDLASDKGGGCSGGIARPEDLILADKYYAEMQQYRQLQQQAQQQASQFTALRQAAENQITLLEGQKALATEELAQLQQSIGNSQEAIEAHKQEIAVAEFRIDALSQLKDWTNQTLLQVLSVEKFNLAQAQLEQEIAEKRGQLIDDAVAAQLEKQRLDIQRDRQIAVTKLEQLNQLNTEEALQQAINNLRTDLGINPIANIITQADYKGQLAGILADLDALKQKQPSLPAELQSILTATRQDIHAALQGKEAATIQDNLLKTVDGLIEQNNKLNTEIAKLDQEEQQYLGILKQSETDLKGASKALYEEIQKTGVLTQEKELLSQQNLEILYKVGYAQGAVDLSDDLARQSQQLLSQIIEGRVKERRIRKKAFVNDILETYARVYEITGTVLSLVGYVYPPARGIAALAFIQAGFIRGVQAAYNGDWKGAMYQIGMASLKALALEYSGGGSIFGFTPSELQTLQQFQIGLSTAYNTYNAYKSENYALAFVSLAKGVADIAAMEFQVKGQDGKPILGGSAFQKGIITLGQTSLDIYNTAQAIDNKEWIAAIKSVGDIADKIEKNFNSDIKDFTKENLKDIYDLAYADENSPSNTPEKPDDSLIGQVKSLIQQGKDYYKQAEDLLKENIGLDFKQLKKLYNTVNTLYDAHVDGSYQSWYSAINNVIGLWGDEIKAAYDEFKQTSNSGSQGETGSNNQDSQGSSGGNSGSTNQGSQDSSSGNSSNQSGQNQNSNESPRYITNPKMIEDEFQKIYATDESNNSSENNNKKNNFVNGVSKGVEIFHDFLHTGIEEAVKEDPQLLKALKLGVKLPANIGFAIIDSAQDGQIKASEIIVNLGGDLFGSWTTGKVISLASKVVAINPYVKVAMTVAGSEVGQQAFKYVYQKAEEKLPVIQNKLVSGFKKLNLSLTDPLVVDLNYDGIKLTNLATSSTFFDIDGDGYAENTAWVSPQDGILTIDLNGDGTINNITEIFSENYGDGTAKSGIEALTTLDSTKNGIISAADDQFNQILVWQDLNQDGISQPNELKTLTQHGITSINLNGLPTETIQDGNIIRTRSLFNRNDGTIGQIADVAFLVTETGFKTIQTANGVQIIAENDSATSLTIFNDTANHTLNLFDTKVQIAIGSTGNDTFYTTGSEGVFLSGGDGNDTLTGGNGNDWIIGDTGADQLFGGGGNDILYIDAQDTVIKGGEGQDIAIVTTNQAITLDLGLSSLEMALGNDGNDTFTNSSTVSVTIDGGKGDDTIKGGSGDDLLIGGEGSDRLQGNLGNDTLQGGSGQDSFFFGANNGQDRIDDFDIATEKIIIDGSLGWEHLTYAMSNYT